MTRKQKVKYLISLVLVLCVVGGIYIFANNMHFLPIMPIYSAISCVGACVYIYLYMKHKTSLCDEQASGICDETAKKHREKLLKLSAVIFLPFIIVLLCDFTYLLLLADSDVFKSVTNFLK